jgi:cell fate regulator YaaT (PSP1 superfamily)
MAKYLASVRYGLMATTENFQTDEEGLAVGNTVIIKTERGIEWGDILHPVQQIDREIKGLGQLLRAATETDLGIIKHIREAKEPEEMSYCRKAVQERKLPMRMVGVEHLFSSDKVIFYFLADGRVDFRELVKELARRYRTRIEMRQIGVRDEARLLADYEHCGRELCCRTFLRSMEPVTMRMAKIQKTTLDPSKISGHCGRLMCCLRFEDLVYTELRKDLPRRGDFIRTATMRGEVINQHIIKQTVTIQLGDGAREEIHISEILERKPGKKSGRDEYEKRNERKSPPPSGGGEKPAAAPSGSEEE